MPAQRQPPQSRTLLWFTSMLHLRAAPITALSLLLACAADAGSSGPATCDANDDCTGREVCVDGLCVNPGGVFFPDEDGDGIPDSWEGRDANIDTDGDGTPDYLDTDSDGDGVGDFQERGDVSDTAPPPDSDGDGAYDFRDTDSDDNGIPDGEEGTGDIDEDGIFDAHDLDNDNDLVLDVDEIGGDPRAPLDSDGDGTPDFDDIDSDNDTIADLNEGQLTDTDGDGILDRFDADSDGDGASDADEAGDDDVRTAPVDSDGDGTADYIDFDSDDDGLSDRQEIELGTSTTEGDSDGDGVSDLIEVGACGGDPACAADATDPALSPRTRGDFVFTVPYEEAPSPELDTLDFRTSIQFADIYFLFDISGSMRDEIVALRDAVVTMIDDLTCTDSGLACETDDQCGDAQICSPFSGTCIQDPAMSSCVLSVWTGTGWYETTYNNLQSLQPDPMVTRDRIRTSTSGGTEELYEAIEGVADPGGISGERGCTGPADGGIGCPSYRPEAVKLLVVFTDENSDGGSRSQAAAALIDRGITMIGVNSGGDSARGALRSIASESMSFRPDGATPLVFDGVDAAVAPVVTMAINEIVDGIPLRVTIDAVDEPDDAGDSLQFIQALRANNTGDGCAPAEVEDTDGDGIPDAFPAVTPGTVVCFDVLPNMNTTVEPTDEPQLFTARLTVYGDGSPLDSRRVFFLVPPVPGEFGPD